MPEATQHDNAGFWKTYEMNAAPVLADVNAAFDALTAFESDSAGRAAAAADKDFRSSRNGSG